MCINALGKNPNNMLYGTFFFHQIDQMRKCQGLEGKFASDIKTDFGSARVCIQVAALGWTPPLVPVGSWRHY